MDPASTDCAIVTQATQAPLAAVFLAALTSVVMAMGSLEECVSMASAGASPVGLARTVVLRCVSRRNSHICDGAADINYFVL